MKRPTRRDSRRTRGKRGFTLIELLIVMVILAILAGIVIISIGGVIGRGQETAYNAERESLQTSVLSYYATNNSTWPTSAATTPATATPGQPGVIDMSLLTVSVAPELPYLDEDPGSANADNNCSPACTGHYLWSVAPNGNVFSECNDGAEDECTIDGDMQSTIDDPVGEDGWQDIYP